MSKNCWFKLNFHIFLLSKKYLSIKRRLRISFELLSIFTDQTNSVFNINWSINSTLSCTYILFNLHHPMRPRKFIICNFNFVIQLSEKISNFFMTWFVFGRIFSHNSKYLVYAYIFSLPINFSNIESTSFLHAIENFQ